MDLSFLTQHSLLFNPTRLISVIIFLVGFVLSIFIWFARDTGNMSIRFFLVYLNHNRRGLLRRLFDEGPGFLILPLWLIFASIGEKYLGPLLGDWLN